MKADKWDTSIEKLTKDMVDVITEQDDNRKKREDMLNQIIRTIAKVEILQHTLTKTEMGFVGLESDVRQFKAQVQESQANLDEGLGQIRNQTAAQDASITKFQKDFRFAVEREARADLTEKRKTT